jgi:proliferating cell nuclear antigen
MRRQIAEIHERRLAALVAREDDATIRSRLTFRGTSSTDDTRMAEIVFHEASFFKRIVDSLKGLVDEVSFDCGARGLSMQAMDPSHIAVVWLSVPDGVFATYSCSEPLSLSFNVETLAKVLKSAAPSDELAIRTRSQTDDIQIQLTSPNQDRSTRFLVRPIEFDHETIAVPERTYAATLAISSAHLSQLVRSLVEVSDNVTVRCSSGTISFEVADSLVEVVTTFTAGVVSEKRDEDIEVDVTEPCKVSYALRYLRVISAAAGLAPRVSLSFAPDFPLLVRYDMSEGGFMKFYQAPKVDDEASEAV